MSDRILVTGATGFIGTHLIGGLVRRGYDVTGIVHETPLEGKGEVWDDVSTVSGDVEAYDSLPDMGEYSVVFHLAGAVSVEESIDHPRRYFRLNALGTQNVVDRARRDDVQRVIYLSSASVYGDPIRLPIDERHPLQTLHPYAASKLAGEHVLEAATHGQGIGGASARGFTVYGPNQRSDNLIPEIIRQLNEGQTVLELGNIQPTRDFVHVEDIVEGLITIMEHGGEGYQVYNIGSEKEASVKEVVDAISDAMGVNPEISSSPSSRDEAVEIERTVADCSRLKQLGWTPTYDLETGIKQLVGRGTQ